MIRKAYCIGVLCMVLGISLTGCKNGEAEKKENKIKQEAKEIMNQELTEKGQIVKEITVTPEITQEITPEITPEATPSVLLPTAIPDEKPIPNVNEVVGDDSHVEIGLAIRQRLYEKETWYRSASVQTVYMPESKKWVTILIHPNSDPRDWTNYNADLWISGETSDDVKLYSGWVVPLIFEVVTIGNHEFFRYDIAYASESVSVLIGFSKDGERMEKNLGGALLAIDGNDFTVTMSTYDMNRIIDDDYFVGHTWKPYYFYFEGDNVCEYIGKELTEEEFMTYNGADELYADILDTYNKDNIIECEYIVRNNGILHVNIITQEDNMINQYYRTYSIDNEKNLELIDEGDGRYLTSAFIQ